MTRAQMLLAFVIPIALCGCPSPSADVIPTPDAAAVEVRVPVTPACLHEVCAERPHSYVCVEWRDGYREAPSCARTDVVYERHCDCDTWAPTVVDGGAK